MSAELTKLTRKRGIFKRRVTEFDKIICDAESEFPGDTVLPRVDAINLEMRLEKVVELLKDFEVLQDQIDEICLAEDPEYTSDELQKFEKGYYAVVTRCRSFLEAKANLASPLQAPTLPRAPMQGNNVADISLPTITLPKFNGQLTKWLEFRDTFEALVHNSSKLSEIQKLYYLRASLVGDAAQIIGSLDICAANYGTAWQLICERYENKRVLIQNHVKALFNVHATKKESSTQLREMLDVISINLRALKGLGQPVDTWDTILIVSLISKIDDTTAREWEAYTRSQRDFPSLTEFKTFLQEKATMLDNLKGGKEEVLPFKHNLPHKTRSLAATNLSCYYCKANHSVYNCTTFLQLSIEDRLKEVKKLRLCENCLRPGHGVRECKTSGCRKCKGMHNSLLHKEQLESVALKAKVDLPCLLPTALVNALDKHGRVCSVLRALLDTGSQSNFMSQETAQYLKLPIETLQMRVSGVNNNETNILGRCSLKIMSRHATFAQEVQFLVIPAITSELPQTEVDVEKLGIPRNVELADPNFASPGPIEILLGAGIFFDVLRSGKIILGREKPTMLETQLGWVFAGGPEVSLCNIAAIKCNFNKTDPRDIENQLAKFWQLEECSINQAEPENFCESHFKDNFERATDGRFVVSIPFTKPLNLLGDSRDSAVKRFLAYERRLSANNKLKIPYVEFMREYAQLNHMTELNSANTQNIEYVLPHHGVVNESSKTTKLRVVFDASNPSSSGYSLNSLQGVGPQIQQELFSILIRFRQHPIAISADVTKMYRQILVKKDQRDLQKIVWRESPSEPLKLFQLNTVTYGTASAPYLAVRCLQQLALEHLTLLLGAAQAVLDDFYVDDFLSGGENVQEVLQLASDVSKILNSGHFPLRKWISNSPEVMKALEYTDGLSCLNLGENENTKTLGLYWETNGDYFTFNISKNVPGIVTKRKILSMTGQVFDPLGLLGACTIKAKLFLQALWQDQKEWDEPLSATLQSEWQTFRNELVCLNSIKIPRYILSVGKGGFQLHGFSDASEKAYGACVYMVDATKSILIASKSKVAPLKSQTIPRLELCAALLLAKLVSKIRSALRLTIDKLYLWSDSTIVLSWIQKPRGDFKIFVGNRVGQIQELTEGACWRYVPSKQNPADLVSRGIGPQELLDSMLWWHGPAFLVDDQGAWPTNIVNQLDSGQLLTAELRTTPRLFVAAISQNCSLIERFSTLQRAKRVIAYCLRFLTAGQSRKRLSGQLSADELEFALNRLIKVTQGSYYSSEVKALQTNGSVKRDSKIVALNPFLDENGILRVGGRLQFSNLTENQKHAIIIPPKSHLSLLIFREEHNRLGHAGPLQLLSSVRDKFWPVHGRYMAKRVVGNCVRCYRVKPVNTIPIMGSLPKERVNPSSPFLITGIDYAGPFLVKRHKGRGAKLEKAYLALFVCFCTKAVHIEVVPDLSSEAFLASLRRFISRRGKPLEIHSDNGTNFVGASKQLDAVIKMLRENSDYIFSNLANEGITWKFIPASAPHFGGIWEAGVKRAKFHIHRIIGTISLTFEELSTLMCQIESILNSRPLTPLSNNPNDLEPLTPSHFLIGRRLASLPEPRYTDIPSNHCTNYQHLQQLLQHFWARWSKEYLPELQPRNKWRQKQDRPLQINELVLIREDNHPPLSWPMGRIMELFRGDDGAVRVASVRTRKGIFRRPAAKLYPLPMEELPTSTTGTVEEASAQ